MKNGTSTFSFLLFLISFMSLGVNSLAQKSKTDSLFVRYKTEKSDTGRITRLYRLIWEYNKVGSYDSALKYANLGLDMATKLNYENKTALFYKYKGIVYKNKGIYSQSLESYLKGLRVSEKHNDSSQTASILTNLGALYMITGKPAEAETSLNKALKISELQASKRRVAQVLMQFANLYDVKNQKEKSFDYIQRALKVHQELGNVDEVIICIQNMGVWHHEKKEYDAALKYYTEALEMAVKNGSKKQMADLYGNIGQIYVCFNKDGKAEEYFLKAIALSDSIGATATLQANLVALSNVYGKMGKIESAYHVYRKAKELKDSLLSPEDMEKITRHEMNYEFEKKEEITRIENEQKLYKERLVSWTIGVGLFIVIVFSAFILRALSITRKQKKTIEAQKQEVELKNHLIEEKNKDIMDSIRYAKRIQNALLREEEHISAHLPEHFIVFMPKDVVSGDFYWAIEKQDYWYFAAVDCTGHGVPGAIMSMLGISFLNDITLSDKLLMPSEILNKLRDRVIFELRQGNDTVGNRDGMDISLCRLNLKTLELQWAGANNALNLVRNGKLEEIKANKQPIGYFPEPQPFTNHELRLQKGDSIYVYSDGYADQFGGPKGKKFTYKRLESLLVENATLPMKEQKEILNAAFLNWKGALEQIDDVCIVGVRV